MAIQMRRGAYEDFVPDKLVIGEWAMVISGDPNSADGKSIYAAFAPGDTKHMATYEDMVENIQAATTEVQEQFSAELTEKIAAAAQAASAANTAASAAQTAKTDADSAAARAIKAAQDCEGLTDNSRVSTLEMQMQQVIEALSKILSTE